MLKEKLLSVSIFCLAISLIISASIVAKGIKSNGGNIEAGLGSISSGINSISANLNPDNRNLGIPKDNYTLDEASVYLGISRSKLIQLVDNKGSGIPYIVIGSDYIFNKNALVKWLETAKIRIE